MYQFVILVTVFFSALWTNLHPTSASKIEDSINDIFTNHSVNYAADYDPLNWNLSVDELGRWRGPKFFYTEYPIYLSGYDYDDRPIWIAEWGKFDLARIVNGGKELQKAFNKYVDQVNYLIEKSLHSTDSRDRNFIVDLQDANIAQLADPQVLLYSLNIGRRYREPIETKVEKLILLNVNYAAEVSLTLGKQIFSSIFERMDTYGNNKERWVPQLRKLYPADQIPPWYGGSKATKPAFIVGSMVTP